MRTDRSGVTKGAGAAGACVLPYAICAIPPPFPCRALPIAGMVPWRFGAGRPAPMAAAWRSAIGFRHMSASRSRAGRRTARFRRRPTTPHLRLKPTSLSTEGAPSLAWDALFSLTHAAPLMPATHDLSPDADHLDDGRPSSIPTASSLASPAINGRSPIPPRGKHESRRAAVPPPQHPANAPSAALQPRRTGFGLCQREAFLAALSAVLFRRSAVLSADPLAFPPIRRAFPPNWTKSSRFSVFCRK